MKLEITKLFSNEALAVLRKANITTVDELYEAYGNNVKAISSLTTDVQLANELVYSTELLFARKYRIKPTANITKLNINELGLSKKATEIIKIRGLSELDLIEMFMEQASDEPSHILPADVKEEIITKIGIVMEAESYSILVGDPEQKKEELSNSIDSVNNEIKELQTELERKSEETKLLYHTEDLDLDKILSSLSIDDFKFSSKTLEFIKLKKLNIFQVIQVYTQFNSDNQDIKLPIDVRKEIAEKVGAAFEYYTTVALAANKEERIDQLKDEIVMISTRINELLYTLDKLKIESAEILGSTRR